MVRRRAKTPEFLAKARYESRLHYQPAGCVDAERTGSSGAGRMGADCAERTLSLFGAQAPNDTRPRDAIEGLRAFARGRMRIGQVRALSARPHAAAREVGDPAVVAAARAAGHAAGVAHMAAHARGAAAYAAQAVGLAAPYDSTAVADELRWQQTHASWAVREVLRRLPPPTRPASILGALISDMHLKVMCDG